MGVGGDCEPEMAEHTDSKPTDDGPRFFNALADGADCEKATGSPLLSTKPILQQVGRKSK